MTSKFLYALRPSLKIFRYHFPSISLSMFDTKIILIADICNLS